MGDDQRTITVAELSDGPPLGTQPDESVDLPVVEILTGRGFVTGKSGSGKSNTASVVIEKLLDGGFPVMIVDIDGEYYGLKEEYEILHVGGDDECDIQVTVEHAEKIASLALEQNVPIILDVSSFLDEDEAGELLTEVSKRLFAKEKKLKQPFLMLVEECHEWIPEKGSVGECGKMLIKIGKRGRKHGLGIVGISQRPADVKKDFITQCDWLVWHRLTWNNDTKVVSRILDGEYADAVEDLDDGEAFMMTDWSESVRRVQFHRKQTFDAGATPGLDDVDRPDLKSVSSDLVSELEEISDEKAQTESRIKELRAELDKKNSRIAELEKELQDARDMSRMADQFVDALVDTVRGPNPGRTEQERMRQRRAVATQSTLAEHDPDSARTNGHDESAGPVDGPADDAPADRTVEADSEPSTAGASESDGTAAETAGTANGTDGVDSQREEDEERGTETQAIAGAAEGAASNGEAATDDGMAAAMAMVGEDSTGEQAEEGADESTGETLDDFDWDVPASLTGDQHEVVEGLQSTLDSMQDESLGMLRHYRAEGPAKPLDAHFAGGGNGDRTNAYAHNRTLRTHGFIEHVGRGYYDYRLRDLLEEECSEIPDAETLETMADAIEDRLAAD